jgi:DUF971 family protein
VNPTPVSINASLAEKIVSMVWSDDHVSRIPFSLLRAGCPCEQCRGGHDKMGDIPDEAVFSVWLPDSPATELKGIVPVGNYGISPQWGDGHVAGIYRWSYLRALCPCPACRAGNIKP